MLPPETDREEEALARRVLLGDLSEAEANEIERNSLFPNWIRGLVAARSEAECDASVFRRRIVARMARQKGVGFARGKTLCVLRHGSDEYDGAVVGDKETLVMEVERNLRLGDVEDFLRRLPRFGILFPDLSAGRVYGAVAFESDADNGAALKLARENGLMLVQVSDKKAMKVLNPDSADLRPIAG